MTTNHTTAPNAQDLWCYEAVAATFGVTTDKAFPAPAQMRWLLEGNGFTVEQVAAPWDEITVGRFIQDHAEGDYIIFTSGHVMALRDNVLTDTEFGGMRRRIYEAFRVTK